MSDQSLTPIFDLGKALAQAEAKTLDAKDTTFEFSANAGQGAAPRVGAQLTHAHVGERYTFSLSAWFEQKFEKDGRSAGVKGKIEFD